MNDQVLRVVVGKRRYSKSRVASHADLNNALEFKRIGEASVADSAMATRSSEPFLKSMPGDGIPFFKKGEMFWYFHFGGSDCVVVFERKANINVTATVGVHYPIRSQYAVVSVSM